MAARNFNAVPNSGEGNGRSGSSSSRKDWISPNEFRRRFESQINASSRVHMVAHHNPMYPATSANQVQEVRRVQSLYYPTSVPLAFVCASTSVSPLTGQAVKEGMRMGSPCYLSSPVLCSLPRVVVRPRIDAHGIPHPAGRSKEDLTLQLVPGSSPSSSPFHFSRLTFSTPSGFCFPERLKMSAGTEDENGCDLELRLGTRPNEGESVSDAQKNKRPRFPAKLLVGQEAEEGGPKNKKARADSVGSSASSSGSCNGEEIDLELRL